MRNINFIVQVKCRSRRKFVFNNLSTNLITKQLLFLIYVLLLLQLLCVDSFNSLNVNHIFDKFPLLSRLSAAFFLHKNRVADYHLLPGRTVLALRFPRQKTDPQWIIDLVEKILSETIPE